MITKTLTGKRRHRAVSLMFKPTILVLQVQEHVTGFEIDHTGYSIDYDRMEWRDATVEDLTADGEVPE